VQLNMLEFQFRLRIRSWDRVYWTDFLDDQEQQFQGGVLLKLDHPICQVLLLTEQSNAFDFFQHSSFLEAFLDFLSIQLRSGKVSSCSAKVNLGGLEKKSMKPLG
jgi:hypothetical protein